MSYAIRFAVVDDAPAISNLVNSAYRGDSGRQGWTTEADLIEGTRTAPELVRALIEKPNTCILVLEEEKVMTGCVELQVLGSRLYFGMLTVDPTRQGGGRGRYLMKAAEDFAIKRGCTAVVMNVIEGRNELLDWYVRQGYSDTGKRKPFQFNDPRLGQPRKPLVFRVMEKILAA